MVSVVMLRGDSAVLHAALGPFFGRLDIEREMGSPLRNDHAKLWWVAFEDGHVCGFCGLEIVRSAAKLCSAYVTPDCRGRRVYARLFRERLKRARKEGVTLRSTCTEASAGTLRRYGFRRIRRKGAYHVMEMRHG